LQLSALFLKDGYFFPYILISSDRPYSQGTIDRMSLRKDLSGSLMNNPTDSGFMTRLFGQACFAVLPLN
ncbi:MAG TPA: hypothetical protein PK683_15230, partial [Leptospiraceae bacterium]|nr:hypothetical protein [Leptospiraceae bacterium]